MNCMTETNEGYDAMALAGTLRFLIGLMVLVFGLYVGFFYEGGGQSLGLLLLFATPFIILKNEKKFY